MKIIGNIDTTHYDDIQKIVKSCDELVIVSPFLTNEDGYEFIIGQDAGDIKKITLYTTLQNNKIESIDKVASISAFFDYCKTRGIEFEVRIDNKLHAKIYLGYSKSKLHSAILTSANFTNSGLYKNHEIGIVIDEKNLSLLEDIEKQIKILKCISLNNQIIKQIEKDLEKYENEKKVKISDIEFNIMDYLPKEISTEVCEKFDWSDSKFFIKPVGKQEDPFLYPRTIEQPREKLHFSKRKPRAVTEGSILICYGVGTTNIVGYYQVDSDINIDTGNARYPHYVFGKNLDIDFSKNWNKYILQIGALAEEYLNQNPKKALTAAGGKTLGALNFGWDKIEITKEFANFIISKIKNRGLSNGSSHSPNKTQSLQEFDNDIRKLISEAISIGYKPTIFISMFNQKGGYETARQLINAQNVSDGYTRLWELKRLDLSIEALVVRKWQSLFTQTEVQKCKDRLKEYHYNEKENEQKTSK